MVERDRQTVGVILTLAGMQDTSVAAHQPRTPDAAVSVRIGGALIYMHDTRTVAKVLGAWDELAREAAALPREISPAGVAPMRGMREPAVVVNASDGPAAAGQLVRRPGRLTSLRLQIGRLLFDVRDMGAYGSTVAAFREADRLSRTTFIGAAATSALRAKALEDASRAFPPPREASRYVAPSRAGRAMTSVPVTSVPVVPRPERGPAR